VAIRSPGKQHFSCQKYFAGPMVSHRPLFADVAIRSPGKQHFSCQKYFAGPMVSHRVEARWHPRLRWFHFGNAGAGMQLTTLCSNKRSYPFISFQGAAAQIVPALLGIRPGRRLAVNFPSAGRWLDPGVEGRLSFRIRHKSRVGGYLISVFGLSFVLCASGHSTGCNFRIGPSSSNLGRVAAGTIQLRPTLLSTNPPQPSDDF
jgi:hypothetical protein